LEHHEHPQQLSLLRKWIAVIVISSASLCVAYASSLICLIRGVANEFGVGHVVTILSISLFVEGLGLGPLLVGPLSEVYGRNAVYRMSYGLFFVFSWPVAFAPNIAVHLIFRFVTGFCGSAFLSVAGGSVSDLFSDHAVANPMALYTISPFIGPVLGPLLSGFINQHLDWRWTYHVEVIWIFIEFIALLILVPETYVPVLTKRKAKQVRKATANKRHWAPIEKESKCLVKAIAVSCYRGI
ncbi:major facilitator superfamily domain-containing protein, partial [Crucibulum laeve]